MKYSHLIKLTKTRWVGTIAALSAVLVISVLASTIVAPHVAHAGGDAGGGGVASGGSGVGANTDYGYGWYKFNADGSGGSYPGGLRNGGTWASVQARCLAQHTTSIVAFIVKKADKSLNTAVVYNYTNKFSTYTLYLGNSGGSWQNYTQAQNAYNSISSAPYNVNTSGLQYGGANGNVAWFCYDYKAPVDWNVTPIVSVNRATAYPGQVITWNHSVKNNGTTTSDGIKYGHNLTPGQVFGPTAIGAGQTISHPSTYTVTQDDVGTNLCRSTIAAPRSDSNSGSISTGPACVAVPYDYALVPTVTVSQKTGSDGTPVTVTPRVTNSGHTKSKPTTWQLTQFTVAPNKPIPNSAGGASASAPCTYFAANTTGCTSPYIDPATNKPVSGSGTVFNLGVGSPALPTASYTMTDLAVGTHICFALSVNPRADDDSKWGHSAPVCVVISKSPQLQVLGGDLRVGAAFTGQTQPAASSIDTSVTIKTDKSYGSWGEYGLIASGTVTGAGSGSAYAGGIDCTASCTTKNLTISNTPATGGYKPTTNIPDVAAAFPTTTSTPNFVSIAHDAPAIHLVKATTNITVSGGTLAAGQWLVINAPTSVVTITGDIKYADTAINSIAEIPQMVIIAKQINIQGAVKNVDAWLVASGSTGSIYTCTLSGATNTQVITAATQLTINLCQNQLTINGPVMAKKLYLQRTFGAEKGTGSDDPAEIINLRPDAYLWGTYQASQNARLDTTATQQLPPRF